MAIISIEYDNFKKLVKDRRIYYFEGDNFIDFHFLFDGFVVKSTLAKSMIVNPQRFFSDKMFYGAIKLDFNIPVPKENPVENVLDMKMPVIHAPDAVDEQDVELKKTDIQREGVLDDE